MQPSHPKTLHQLAFSMDEIWVRKIAECRKTDHLYYYLHDYHIFTYKRIGG
jgi:hypothetical protein